MSKMSIDLDDPKNHPIAIFTSRNEEMKAWDLQLFVGNFKSEAEANSYAEIVKEFLEEDADGKFLARA